MESSPNPSASRDDRPLPRPSDYFRGLVSFMGSLKFTVLLFLIIVIASIIGTLICQEKAQAAVYHSKWFTVVLIILVHNLAFCTFKRIKRIRLANIGFLCVHIGVMLTLAGTLIGSAWGVKGRIIIPTGKTASHFRISGKIGGHLPFEVTLDKFELEFYDHGKVGVVGPSGEEPVFFPAIVGKKYSLPQYDCTLEILEYVPDFLMDMSKKTVTTRSLKPSNPALRVRLSGSETREKWLFQRYGGELPGTHQQAGKKRLPFRLVYSWAKHIKSYKSYLTVKDPDGPEFKAEVEVNEPLEYKGYSLYQVSYDEAHHRYTDLMVVSDPGLGVVYTGFFLLVAGITYVLYIKPLFRKRLAKEAVH